MFYIIAWLVLMVVLVIVEFLTLGLTCIWFAIGSLFAAIVALLGGNIWFQVIVFGLVSLAMLIFTKPVAQKYFNSKIQKTNLDELIDEKCVVTEEINNLKATGTVMLKGKEWTARSLREDEIIPAGNVVTLKQIEGVKAIVVPEYIQEETPMGNDYMNS